VVLGSLQEGAVYVRLPPGEEQGRGQISAAFLSVIGPASTADRKYRPILYPGVLQSFDRCGLSTPDRSRLAGLHGQGSWLASVLT
jgi:hypothetical protein